MSPSHYAQVRFAFEHQLPEDSIARNLGLSSAEVQRAVLSKDYETYSTVKSG